jgi:hypothetical protein
MTPRAPVRELSDGYSAEVDAVSVPDWYRLVSGFRDASIYQLWQHAPGHAGSQRTSRLLLRRGGQVVAAAEVRLFTVPLTRRGIAYVRWGPLWNPGTEVENAELLQQALRALYAEYVTRRGMILRIAPRLTIEDTAQCPAVFGAEGFSRLGHLEPSRTLLMPLTGTLVALRSNLAQKWRNGLNKAEKSGLRVTRGTGLELFDEFELVYQEMLQRKGLSPTADLHRHRAIQAVLPESMKMGVLLARHETRPCAGLIFSALGDTAVYLFGATNEVGMRTSASYLLQWEAVRLLTEAGVKEYDLNGINPELNPGTYHFKKGLAGKTGREVLLVGQLQACRRSLTNRVLLSLDRMRHRLRTRHAGEQATDARQPAAAPVAPVPVAPVPVAPVKVVPQPHRADGPWAPDDLHARLDRHRLN